MDLDFFIGKDQVIEVSENEKQAVIREMIEKLNSLSVIENKERYYAQIIHRESLENTYLGSGFAIPHARTDSVGKFISILGIHRKGIDYHTEESSPVHYILLTLFPTHMSTSYLYLIGMMARIFSCESRKKLLDSANSPQAVHDILKKEAEMYFNSISQKEIIHSDEPETLSGMPSSDLDLLIRLDRLYNMYDNSREQKESLTKKIDGLKALINNRSLTYYERMRKKSSNPFAIVDKTSCSGCHMEIPPVYLKQISDRNELTVCSYCGRFLIMV